MTRINVYWLLPTAEDTRLLRGLGDRVAALWDVAQCNCRHRYLHQHGHAVVRYLPGRAVLQP